MRQSVACPFQAPLLRQSRNGDAQAVHLSRCE